MVSALRVAVQIENFQETLGIGLERPKLSWKIYSGLRNWRQAAYEIICTRHDGRIGGETGRIESNQSHYLDWPFEPLQSREWVSVRVRVWGEDGSESEWSEPVIVEAGLLNPTDWDAVFITPAFDEANLQENQPVLMRREFKIGEGALSARLYITALGVYEVYLNGRQVGDHVLAPGWTVYHDRLLYQTFDVTDLLQYGLNGIGAIVADGWYRGRLGFGEGESNIYGEYLGLLAQLEIVYVDGTIERYTTDDAWRSATGGIVKSGIYDGETFDARLEPEGWSKPRFDDSAWSPVRHIPYDLGNLEAPLGPPIRRTETLNPITISESPSGKTLVDFGQNLVGRLKMRVQGEAGHTITLRHAEVLEDGELGTRPLRYAAQTDRFTLRGEGVESWEPKFTFHGFRYVEITNWPGELRKEDIQAIVLHSDMEHTGWFESSDPLLNQLHKNVVWSMRGNFVGIPTDCPQRDERLGWTGDIQVFAPAATFLYDVKGFLHSWLIDLSLEQKKHHGAVPHVVPDILHHSGAAAWGDAAVIVPWTLYQRYGDKGVLADQFKSMCDWVDFVARVAGDSYLWNSGFQFGDWLDPTAPSDEPWKARTDQGLVASAYFGQSAKLVREIAEIL
ncbi:MAG: family 78 glycoside hydrolase catalytic domain, partial [Chloroflexota bacterium]